MTFPANYYQKISQDSLTPSSSSELKRSNSKGEKDRPLSANYSEVVDSTVTRPRSGSLAKPGTMKKGTSISKRITPIHNQKFT